MKLSLSTACLYVYPLPTLFRWARGAGFDGVEVAIGPEAIARGGPALQRLAQQSGIAIFSVHPPLAPLPGWRERHGGLGPILSLAQRAGAGLVVTHVPHSQSLETGEGLRFRQQVEVWQRGASGRAVQIAIENKAIRAAAQRQYALTPPDRLRQFADDYDLGLVLDTCHAASAGEDLMAIRGVFGERLTNVHLSDANVLEPGRTIRGMNSLRSVRSPRRRDEHRFPGTGMLPLEALLRALSVDGYSGLVTLEVSPVAMRAWWPPAARRRIADAATWVRRAVRTDPH